MIVRSHIGDKALQAELGNRFVVGQASIHHRGHELRIGTERTILIHSLDVIQILARAALLAKVISNRAGCNDLIADPNRNGLNIASSNIAVQNALNCLVINGLPRLHSLRNI